VRPSAPPAWRRELSAASSARRKISSGTGTVAER
jgi:hypothetical protein